MAGVTPQGFVTKTQQQIVDKLIQRLGDRFGKDFPTSPDSVTGQYTNIIAAALKENWDLGQQLADSQNRDKAGGLYLDYLARLIGLTRRAASGSTGDVLWIDSQNTVIPAFSVVEDTLKRKVLTQETITLASSECYKAYVKVFVLTDNSEYSVSVNGVKFSYTSSSPAVEDYVLSNLAGQVNTATDATADVEDNTLVITFESFRNGMSVGLSGNLGFDRVGCLIRSEAATKGDLNFPEGSIVSVISDFPDSEVTNIQDFDLGRYRETDVELRVRMEEREESTGTATVPAIEASISELQGVQGVILTENRTMSFVGDLPPKSYECYVVGGDEEDIANVIWDTKPAGIETHGNISKVIVDNDGELQTVKFSRKSVLYAWVKITYTPNPEEEQSNNPVQAIKTAVADFGNGFDKDEDFERTKFFGPIYSDVTGVYVDNIEIATTSDPDGTPSYQTARIPVGGTQELIFSEDRVEVV